MKSHLIVLFLFFAIGVLPAQGWQTVRSETSESLTAIDFADEQVGYAVGTFGAAIKTVDGGQTWTALETGIGPSLVSVQALTPDTVLAARNVMYATTDGGQTWEEYGTLTDIASGIFGIHFTNFAEGFILMGGAIWRTDNAGQTWQSIYEAGFSSRLTEAAPDTFFLSGGRTYDGFSISELHRSIDGGKNWEPLSFVTNDVIGLSFVNGRQGFLAAHGGQLYATNDAGDSWTPVGEPLEQYVTALYFVSPSEGYAGTYEGNILRTVDGGLSWTQEFTGTEPINMIASNGAGLFAVGNSGVLVVKALVSSTQDPAAEAGISVYPNPVNGQVNIRWPAGLVVNNWRLLDATGRPVAAGRLTVGKNEEQLDIQRLAPATYFLQLLSDGRWLTQRLIVIGAGS